MSAAQKLNRISIDDYLAGELESSTKHEYLAGFVYAMAGARNEHNLIASNILIAIGSRLTRQSCRAYNSDTKVRIQLTTGTRFYYPDVQIVCQPNRPTESFQDNPSVLVEVLSRGTRRIDEGEKKDAYMSIPTLRVYLLVEPEIPAVVAYRRGEAGFVREVHEGIDAVVSLPEVGVDLSLAAVYGGVEFVPEEDSQDNA